MSERSQEFDIGQFVKDYTAASSLQGTVIARAFYSLETQMNQRFDGVEQRLDGVDRRFDSVDQTLNRIVRVLALAHPDEYRQAFSENGHKPPDQSNDA